MMCECIQKYSILYEYRYPGMNIANMRGDGGHFQPWLYPTRWHECQCNSESRMHHPQFSLHLTLILCYTFSNIWVSPCLTSITSLGSPPQPNSVLFSVIPELQWPLWSVSIGAAQSAWVGSHHGYWRTASGTHQRTSEHGCRTLGPVCESGV